MIEKMRKDFESWIEKETGFDTFRTNFPMTKPEDQQYMCHHTNLAWLAWQASSAADKDAARYRWIKENSQFGVGRCGVDWELYFEGPAPDNSAMIELHIDEAMQCK